VTNATEPLHPNLARIAAAYDDVHRRYGIRQLSAADAKAEILALQARDDDGIIWRISPEDGTWLRKTRDGRWEQGTPPRSGLATPTAAIFAPGGAIGSGGWLVIVAVMLIANPTSRRPVILQTDYISRWVQKR
jgi:hypothetical protein